MGVGGDEVGHDDELERIGLQRRLAQGVDIQLPDGCLRHASAPSKKRAIR